MDYFPKCGMVASSVRIINESVAVTDLSKSVIRKTFAISMLNSASAWMLSGFLVAGVIHEFVGPDKMQKSAIGSTKISGILWTMLTGMCLSHLQLRYHPSGRQHALFRSVSGNDADLHDIQPP